MNVLHLSSEKSWRGGEQQIAYLLEELNKKGINNFVAVRRNSAFEKYCKEKHLQNFSLPFRNEFDLQTAFQIKKICREFRIDLIHIHSSHSHGLAVWSALLGNSTPMVLSRKVDFPVKRNPLSYFKYNHKQIKKIICVSEKIKEIVSESIEDKDKCITIYDGIDLSRFDGKVRKNILRRALNIPETAFLTGNISAIAPHKDYFTFTDTAEIVLKAYPDSFFIIVGDGPLFSQVKEYIEKKGLKDKIIMTGFRNDVPEIMADLDLFLMSSRTEGLGTTILDAMSCSVPVVATNAGGIPEVIQHEKSGLLGLVQNPENLAEQVIRLIRYRDLRENLKEGGRARVKEFSKEKMASRTLDVYEEVIRKSG
jgi:L-malate glycosyltransferase